MRQEDAPGGAGAAGPRYLMLETLREFGLEQLAEIGELREARDAHAAAFLALDAWLEPNHLATGERFDDRLRRIEAEHPNLRAALAHLAEVGDAESVLRLAGTLAVFWYHLGTVREGRRWLEWALERAAATPTVHRARALAGLSLVVWNQGDHEAAEPLAEAGLAIAERLGEPELAALSIHVLAHVERVRGRWERAEPLMERALDLWRALDLPSDAAMALLTLSEVADGVGDAAMASARAEEALTIFRTLGYSSGVAITLSCLARYALDRGDHRRAALAYQEGLRLWAGIGERWIIVRSLTGVAALAVASGQPESAATLLGAIDALMGEADVRFFPTDRGTYDRACAPRPRRGAIRRRLRRRPNAAVGGGDDGGGRDHRAGGSVDRGRTAPTGTRRRRPHRAGTGRAPLGGRGAHRPRNR